ncbi:MAG: helix-turn-helix transcriptional regulator [Thermomicrobiales bacterium]
MSQTDWMGPKVIAAKAPAVGFGEELQRHLTRCRLSQAKLAERTGCNSSYINRVVNGSRVPGREMITAIADALELGTEDALRLAILGLIPDRYQAHLLDAVAAMPDIERFREAADLIDAIRNAVREQRERRVA